MATDTITSGPRNNSTDFSDTAVQPSDIHLLSHPVFLIGNLTLRITHDLSNSFTSILMNAELVLDVLNDLLRTPTPEQCASLRDSGLPEIRDVIRKIREMTEYTKTLRDYAGQPLTSQTLDLNIAINETLSIARTLLGSTTQIDFLPSADLPALYTDRFRIDQLLLTIIRFLQGSTPSEASIVIRTEPATLDQEFSFTHSGARPGTYTRLTIQHSSPGIDSQQLTRVFDLPTTEIFDSVSLNLSIVYSIVKRFGGYITVESSPGQGTRFDIYFPTIPTPLSTSALNDQGKASLSQSDESISSTHSSLILIADDDTDIQQTIARYISREIPGYQITFAADGQTTLALYRQLAAEGKQPALLIADMGLPQIDGRSLSAAIQQQFPSALILLTSGYTIDTNPITSKTPDGFHFLQKPFEPNSLIITVKRLLKEVGMSDEGPKV